jgi:RNA polymerase sigma-70 factor (TIGR02943 family)
MHFVIQAVTYFGQTVAMLTAIEKSGNRSMAQSRDFADAVAASRSYLLRFARLQLRNDAWAEDVVADTMLAALEKPDSFGGKSSLNTWLVGILKFKIIDCLRAHSREVASSVNCDEDAELEELLFIPDGHFRAEAQEWPNPEQSLNSKQFLDVMDVCISEMPQTMGRVFLMREWMEFSTDEICKEMLVSSSNVWVLLHRARLRLRECLQQKWFGNGAQGHVT